MLAGWMLSTGRRKGGNNVGCGGRGSSVGEEQQPGMWGGGVPGLGQWVTATTFLFSKVDVNKFWKYIRGVPLSHFVISSKFGNSD